MEKDFKRLQVKQQTAISCYF